jgi:xylan 1,4-beta-xylosidase
VDFVSTHIYGDDTSEDVFGAHDTISNIAMVPRAAKKVFDEVKASARPLLPIIWSEYNATARNDPQITDAPYMGPWLADTIRQCDGLAEMMSYWDFSDVFDEQGVVKTPFYGGYGLIAVGHVPKAAFNAFALLHRLGDRRLPVASDSALVTVNPDGSLAIAVWNYAKPDGRGPARRIEIALEGWSGSSMVRFQVVDRDHGSALGAWKTQGSPAFPTREQQRELIRAAQMPPAQSAPLTGGRFALTLPVHALALLEIPASRAP